MTLPEAFKNRMFELLGDETELLTAALADEPPVSIRLNVTKSAFASPPFSLTSLSPVSWCAEGYYLEKRPSFTFDPLFHAGCYYVQEASSMFLEQVLKQHLSHPVVMLDLCASPGGKSTHARSLLPEGSLLVANEVIRTRAQVLSENLTKWGNPDVMVTNNDPSDFSRLNQLFDVILTDVPCSGEGMFRKDPAAIGEWSPAHVEICWQRQRRILADVWPALKAGGILIYSTCTYNTKENEENIRWIADELDAEVLSVEVPDEWGITGNLAGGDFPVYRFFPHKTKGEGFFLAVLRKNGEEAHETPPSKVEPLIKKQLKVIQSRGIEEGTLKGKDLIPSHALAMSSASNGGVYPTCSLTYPQAIAYLRREALQLDATVPKGYVLVTFRDVPLGFVKNIGNRANNLYPQEWRIRSGYMPDEIWML